MIKSIKKYEETYFYHEGKEITYMENSQEFHYYFYLILIKSLKMTISSLVVIVYVNEWMTEFISFL